MEVGNWVLAESIAIYNQYSRPRRITKISGSRVYVELPRRDKAGEIKEWESRYYASKSIMAVFDTEEQAQAVFDLDQRLSDKEQDDLKVLHKQHQEYRRAEMKKLRESFKAD